MTERKTRRRRREEEEEEEEELERGGEPLSATERSNRGDETGEGGEASGMLTGAERGTAAAAAAV